jgi:hypothetical protein
MINSLRTPNRPKPDQLDRRWIAALFAKLQGRYGHKWSSAYPAGTVLEVALAEWAEGLAGCTGDDIKRGLDQWQDDWPPTLPEFRKACRPRRLALAHAPFPRLAAPVHKLSQSLAEYLKGIRV